MKNHHSCHGHTTLNGYTCFHSQFPSTLVASVVIIMTSPLLTQAAVTPSLKNLLNSVVAGGVVLAAIVAAVSAVANFDPVDRA